MNVTVTIPKHLLSNLRGLSKHVVEPTLVAVATETMHKLQSQKPPPPPRGKMRFKSERQRKFVMMSIRNGSIDVPYRRGISANSQRMNRSFRLVKSPQSVYLTNTATYHRYVIGDKQAEIHRNRWKTATAMAREVMSSGVVEQVLKTTIERMF